MIDGILKFWCREPPGSLLKNEPRHDWQDASLALKINYGPSKNTSAQASLLEEKVTITTTGDRKRDSTIANSAAASAVTITPAAAAVTAPMLDRGNKLVDITMRPPPSSSSLSTTPGGNKEDQISMLERDESARKRSRFSS